MSVTTLSRQFFRHSPYHPDVILFLVLIPLISAFNYYLTYSDIRFNGFLVLTYAIDTVQGYAAWLVVRAVILFLDRTMPYEKGLVKRIALQVISTTLIGLFVISALTELASWIVKGRPASLSFYQVDLFIISIWFFVINGIYIGLHYFHALRNTEKRYRETIEARSQSFVVRQGRQDIKVDFEEVNAFFVEGEYVAAYHRTGKKYYLDQSLDKIEHLMPPENFFRLNRKCIVHRRLISGFRRIENGKLQVSLEASPGLPQEMVVSRTKASVFKQWFYPVLTG